MRLSIQEKKILDGIVRRMKEISGMDFSIKLTDDGMDFISEDYFKFQDSGVAGTKSGNSSAGYKFGDKMPPASSFSKYTSDVNAQFAIAKSVQQEGIKAKNYSDEFAKDPYINSKIEEFYYERITSTDYKI